jgi:Domain of unknown function (DUF4112)
MAKTEDLAVWPYVVPHAGSGSGTSTPRDIDRARKLARILDHYGVDALLGLVLPGIGDVLGSVMGLYLVGIALRRRISPVVIARMLLNLTIDAGIGIVPLAGDVADFLFKANEKNLQLLLDRHSTGKATARDWLAVGGAILAFVAVVGLVIYAVIAVLRAIM